MNKDDQKLLIELLFHWLEEIPEGLDPTFYFSGSYNGDLEIQKRLFRILELEDKIIDSSLTEKNEKMKKYGITQKDIFETMPPKYPEAYWKLWKLKENYIQLEILGPYLCQHLCPEIELCLKLGLSLVVGLIYGLGLDLCLTPCLGLDIEMKYKRKIIFNLGHLTKRTKSVNRLSLCYSRINSQKSFSIFVKTCFNYNFSKRRWCSFKWWKLKETC